MNRKYSLLLVLITAVFELAFLVWTRADYRSTLLDGEEYEVPAAIEFQGDFYDRNYIAAVSYTHLDVYKRQPARYVPFMAFLISMRGMWRPFWKRLLMNTEKKRGLPILPW